MEIRRDGNTEIRNFGGTLKPLMSEEEKKEAQILELSYDFACRIIRLYKYLNEGKLSKADRDIIDALGRQVLIPQIVVKKALFDKKMFVI